MSDKIIVNGGPFLIARRKSEADPWEINEEGVDDMDAVNFLMAALDPSYQYSYVDVRELPAEMISRTEIDPDKIN